MINMIQILDHAEIFEFTIFDFENGNIIYENKKAKESGRNIALYWNRIKKTLGDGDFTRVYFCDEMGKTESGDVYRLNNNDKVEILVAFNNGISESVPFSDDEIKKLCEEWQSVFLIDFKTNEGTVIKSIISRDDMSSKIPEFDKYLVDKIKTYIHPEDVKLFNEEFYFGEEKKNDRQFVVRMKVKNIYIKYMFRFSYKENGYLILTGKNAEKNNELKLDEPQNQSIIMALSKEYCSISIVYPEMDTYINLDTNSEVPDISGNISYTMALKEYCNNYVCKRDCKKVFDFACGENAIQNIKDEVSQKIFQLKDETWMVFKYIEIQQKRSDAPRTFLLSMTKYNKEMQAKIKRRRTDEILSTLAGAYQAIYRVNIITGTFEIIMLRFKEQAFAHRFDDFYELEDYFKNNMLEKEYISADYDHLSRKFTRQHFSDSDEELCGYFKEKSGMWIKLLIKKDYEYSEENPYLIYAMTECNDEIANKTSHIINSSAFLRMYIDVVVINIENESFECLRHSKYSIIDTPSGNIKNFLGEMHKYVYEEDYAKIENLIYSDNEDSYREEIYRIEDQAGMVHFRSASTIYVDVPDGKIMLFLVRDIDEQMANRNAINTLSRENDFSLRMLHALGEAYYAIYYGNVHSKRFRIVREHAKKDDIFNVSDYDEIIELYLEKYVASEYRKTVANFFNTDFVAKNLKKPGENIYTEYLRRFGDEYKWVRMDVRALKCKNGKATDVVVAFRDIHTEKQKELDYRDHLKSALEIAEQGSAAKSKFLSSMSHDIRTPMNAIIGMTDIAINHMNEKERVKSCLNRIDVASRHLLQLINEVLDVSYIESGKILLNEGECSLPDLMHKITMIVQEQIKEKSIDFTFDAVNVKNEIIYADKVRMNQIVMNLLGNAIKYTQNGGRIHMEIRQEPDYKSGIGTYVITVQDTGIGMSEEFQKKIFQPFERENENIHNKKEGTGLGMTITKSLVELMGGTISVKSTLGVGTTFIVTLPRKYSLSEPDNRNYDMSNVSLIRYKSGDKGIIDKIKRIKEDSPNKKILVYGTSEMEKYSEAIKNGMTEYIIEPVFNSDVIAAIGNLTEIGENVHQTEKTEYDFTGKKILVVDDNEINRDIANDYLEDVNASYENAADGEAAYQLIASGHEYDAILMDIQMPVLDGYTATRKIRQINTPFAQSVPIIAMTADAFADDKVKSAEAGMNDHISKPVSSKNLYKILALYI